MIADCAASARSTAHTQLFCNATAAAGVGWRIRVRAPGSAVWSASPSSVTFSYAQPLIALVETMPMAADSSPGPADDARPTDGEMRLVRLVGNNFGRPGLAASLVGTALFGSPVLPPAGLLEATPSASLCIMFAWTGRPESPASLAEGGRCDGLETVWGEGEVASVRVLAWDDDEIIFEQPSGLGSRDIVLSVLGQMSPEARALQLQGQIGAGLVAALNSRWDFDTPVFSGASVSPSSIAADGMDIISLSGALNLGPEPRDTTENPVDAFTGFPMALTEAAVLPTAGLLINVTRYAGGVPSGSVCITGLKGLQGDRPIAWTGCAATPYEVKSRSHEELSF